MGKEKSSEVPLFLVISLINLELINGKLINNQPSDCILEAATEKMPSQVSAIIPVFNAEKTLKRAVDSILAQPEITQILLVEDGSKDSSLSICKELAEAHPQITLLQHPNGDNRGAPASRNLGLAHAIHPWIQFMDADDELLPGKIADQLACITGHECLVVGHFVRMNQTPKTISPKKDVWAGLLTTRLGNSIANLWNTHWVKDAGGWDESLLNVQEYHLMFEMLKRNDRVSFSKQNLTRVFPQPNSITNSNKEKREKRDTYFKFRNEVRNYLIEKRMYNFFRKHYYTITTGEMLRYHQPSFPISFNKSYFWIYKNLKALRN